MPNLKISTSGDDYTQAQQILMWKDIHLLNKCPECGANDTMYYGPHHGPAQNTICASCHTVFWTSPIRCFGAYPVARQKTHKLPITRVTTFTGNALISKFT